MAKSMADLAFAHLLLLSMAVNVGLLLKLKKESGAGSLLNGLFMCGLRRAIDGSPISPQLEAAAHPELDDDYTKILKLSHGDPMLYEKFWKQAGENATIVIPGWQSISYFSDVGNVCWFLEPEFAREILRLHRVVGNAVTDDRYIVVGAGSSQLFHAVLYALSPQDSEKPVDIVSASPFYSSYPAMTDCLKSGLYKWAGDASTYEKDGPFIELVTYPNNPDGHIRLPAVNRSGGALVHDLAYYWPQYTPITRPADHDIMLFSGSKCTGHAGTRIGWALVKSKEVAEKMVDFIVLDTIGVSKDSQLRSAKILQVISDGCEASSSYGKCLFRFGYHHLNERWLLLREASNQSGLFTLPIFTPNYCKFSNRTFESQPAFAWLKCDTSVGDCEEFLKSFNVLSRGGKQFGASSYYTRVSLLDRDEVMRAFFRRLAMAKSPIQASR